MPTQFHQDILTTQLPQTKRKEILDMEGKWEKYRSPGYPPVIRVTTGHLVRILIPGALSSPAGLGKAQASAITPCSPANFEAQPG